MQARAAIPHLLAGQHCAGRCGRPANWIETALNRSMKRLASGGHRCANAQNPNDTICGSISDMVMAQYQPPGDTITAVKQLPIRTWCYHLHGYDRSYPSIQLPVHKTRRVGFYISRPPTRGWVVLPPYPVGRPAPKSTRSVIWVSAKKATRKTKIVTHSPAILHHCPSMSTGPSIQPAEPIPCPPRQ